MMKGRYDDYKIYTAEYIFRTICYITEELINSERNIITHNFSGDCMRLRWCGWGNRLCGMIDICPLFKPVDEEKEEGGGDGE